MSSYLYVLTAADVTDARSFAAYAQQCLGTPEPRGRDIALLQRKLNDFFLATPRATWLTLAHTVEWCRARKRRSATAWGVISHVRWAWSDGLLPELNPQPRVDHNTEYLIELALATESSEMWRDRLIGACGIDNRRAALSAWQMRS